MVEHRRGIVEDQSVHLAYADDDLDRMAERVRGGDHVGDDTAQRSPGELAVRVSALTDGLEEEEEEGDQQQ